jgi:DNA processing protein
MEVATDIHKIDKNSPYYPALLKEIPDAPDTLYVRGNVASLVNNQLPTIAIVGTRKPTPYGIQTTHSLVSKLAGKSVIVSGLAYGVDAQAHESALKSGGITWAVLGTGLDDKTIYPTKNLSLAHKILNSGGLLISEYVQGTPPLPHHFPLRNRIIAGLSEKVVVIEAPISSGALITAKLALDYNREVLAVPGSIFSEMSVGPNKLISEGAVVVKNAQDILEVSYNTQEVDLTDAQRLVYKALMSSPKHLDEIVRETSLPVNEVSSMLTLLEMRGMIKNIKGKFIKL